MTSHSRGRWAPFWVSLTFAAVFVLLRIGYRLVFGSISWQAIGQALTLALPFAVVIVVCGFLSALIDVRKLLPAMSALRYGRSIGTALAIALSSYPTLIHQVTQLDAARKLRGIRSRSAFLVPLLEHTIERAGALAAAMDLRGFGSASSPDTNEDAPIVFNNFSLSYGSKQVLRDVELTLTSGSFTVVTGQTGSGKTALLESIAGLSQHFHNGHTRGTLTIGALDRNLLAPRHTAGLIGYVCQDVRLGFAAVTAREELEFGLRVSGQNRAAATARADELITQFSLTSFANQPLQLLSAGEATRVAIAAALAAQPRILLMDEPLADLDSDSRSELITLMQKLQHSEQLTIVLAEHHTTDLNGLSPRWLSIDAGAVSEGQWNSVREELPSRSIALVGRDEIFTVENLTLSYGPREVLRDISLTAHVGEILAITGANGAGKSSLLAALVNESRTRTRTRQCFLVPENVSSLFISETLEEELDRADLIAGHKNSGLTALTFWSILATEPSAVLLATHPRDLSAGTQIALGIALQLSWKPGVILIDEPTRGLDDVSRHAMSEVLRCVAETGTAVIFASHDHAFIADVGCRVLTLHDGVLLPSEVDA